MLLTDGVIATAACCSHGSVPGSKEVVQVKLPCIAARKKYLKKLNVPVGNCRSACISQALLPKKINKTIITGTQHRDIPKRVSKTQIGCTQHINWNQESTAPHFTRNVVQESTYLLATQQYMYFLSDVQTRNQLKSLIGLTLSVC